MQGIMVRDFGTRRILTPTAPAPKKIPQSPLANVNDKRRLANLIVYNYYAG